MADISKITLPSNATYDIKDTTARTEVAGKQDTITVDGILQGDGEGNITAADTTSAGTVSNPSSDGTYVLLNTISSGTSTLSWGTGGSGGSGGVTSVGVANATNGGLTVSGSPIASSGTITIGHSNVLTSAQTTQAVYPIKIDKNGHISAYGSAVTIPTSATSSTTGISVADHSTTTIYGVGSNTTTASKASGANGSAPTLGTAISVPNVTSVGSASNWVFEDVTVPKAATSSTTVPIKDSNATSIPNVTAVGSGSFTSGSFSGGSGSFSATVTNHVLSFSHTHTAATHGADSHTHTAPTLGTAISIYGVQSTTTSVTGVSGSVTGSHVKSGGNGTAPTLGTAISVPNVTSVGSASTWSFSDVTVPIKDSSSTTVVTSKTHSVTDNGHTHALS